ncbi:MAG: hypothetical protein R3F62_06255 [Planctomycetota bacterium]
MSSLDEDQIVGQDPFAWATRMDVAELAEGWRPTARRRPTNRLSGDSARLRVQPARPRSQRLSRAEG